MHLALDGSGYPIGDYPPWKAANAPVTGATPNADEDGDGVAYGVEYLLGGNIIRSDLVRLPQISIAGSNMLFTFVRVQASIEGITTVAI